MTKQLAILLSLCCCCATWRIVTADEPAPPTIDQQLLDDLGAHLPDDGVGAATPPTASAKAQPSDVDQQLMDDLDGEDLGEREKQPLERIAEQMKLAQQRISKDDTSAATQQLQQRISENLAKLIEQAEKQQGSNGNSSSKPEKSGKPGAQPGEGAGDEAPQGARDSSQRVDRGEAVERESTDVKQMLRQVWGHLPEKMREQMQNSVGEEFLPKYEKLIEDYYRRLAEKSIVRP